MIVTHRNEIHIVIGAGERSELTAEVQLWESRGYKRLEKTEEEVVLYDEPKFASDWEREKWAVKQWH